MSEDFENLTAVPSSPQLDGYHGTCENLYEDVETINGYLSGQNSRTLKEHKGGPKSKKPLTSKAIVKVAFQ